MKVEKEDAAKLALALVEADVYITFMKEYVCNKKRGSFDKETREALKYIKSEQLNTYGLYNVSDLLEEHNIDYGDLVDEISE